MSTDQNVNVADTQSSNLKSHLVNFVDNFKLSISVVEKIWRVGEELDKPLSDSFPDCLDRVKNFFLNNTQIIDVITA